jgi:hypothetical protein
LRLQSKKQTQLLQTIPPLHVADRSRLDHEIYHVCKDSAMFT